MKKKFNLLNISFVFLLMLISLSSVKAQQEEMPPDGANAPKRDFDKPRRPDLLKTLGLSPDQQEQIRQINIERKPQMRAAQDRLREANRNLDQAIYADIVNDSVIQMRLKDVQSAQAELIRIRSMTELAVRQILTPEQLQKFRDVRRQFADKMKNRFNRQSVRPPNAPSKNNSRPNQPPPNP